MSTYRLPRLLTAVLGVLALVVGVFTLPVAARAADSVVSAEDLAKQVTLTVNATEDISNRSLVAVRLGSYTYATTDGTNLTGVDVNSNTEWAAKVDAALKAAKIDTSKPDPNAAGATAADKAFAYDASNPMPWVVKYLMSTQDPETAGGQLAADGTTAWQDQTPPNLRAFLTALREQLNDPEVITGSDAQKGVYVLKTSTDDKVAGATVDPGVYVILDQTAAAAGTTEAQAADTAAIPMFNGTGINVNGTEIKTLVDTSAQPATTSELGTVVYKVNEVTVSKTVQGPDDNAPSETATTAAIGKDVRFTLTTTVPNYTGYDKYWLQLADSMGTGLTFKEVTSVKVGTTEYVSDTSVWKKVDGQNGAFTIFLAPTTDETGADISNLLSSDDVKAKFPVGQTVTVTYTATLDKDAVILSTGNPNTVTVQYSHNPNDWKDLEKSPEDTVKVYTGTVTLKKVDNAGKTLAGAVFNIYQGSAKTALPIVKVKDGSATEAAVYRLADAVEVKGDTAAGVTKVTDTDMTVPASGLLTVHGLKGWYTITEKSSPFGTPSLLLPSFEFDITPVAPQEGTDWVNSFDEEEIGLGTTRLVADGTADADATFDFQVTNPRSLLQMPKTGAAFISFYVALAAILGLAGTALVLRSRRREN